MVSTNGASYSVHAENLMVGHQLDLGVDGVTVSIMILVLSIDDGVFYCYSSPPKLTTTFSPLVDNDF
jgi:hypothetical protein